MQIVTHAPLYTVNAIFAYYNDFWSDTRVMANKNLVLPSLEYITLK